MTVWTREQISQARGIRAAAQVDESLIARDRQNVVGATLDKMFGAMTNIGHSFAIELHREDIRFRETEGDLPFTVTVTAWWEPQVREVEFRGGPRDGQRMELERPGEPLRVLHMPPINLATYDPAGTPSTLGENAVTYEAAGWHEQGRYWIYEA